MFVCVFISTVDVWVFWVSAVQKTLSLDDFRIEIFGEKAAEIGILKGIIVG